jgi:hypothetical protein
MKSKTQKVYLYLIFSSLLILCIFTGILNAINKNLSSIATITPFSLEIYRVPLNEAEHISVYGFTIKNEKIALEKSKGVNIWHFDKNTCLTKILIHSEDSLLKKISDVKVVFSDKTISINEFSYDKKSTCYDISNDLRIRETKANLVTNFFQPEILIYYLSIFLLIIIYFGNIVFVLFKFKIKHKIQIMLTSVVIQTILFHFLFFMFTGVYLVTSGVFLIIILWWFTLGIIKLISLIRREISISKNTTLLVSTIFSTLILVEIILLLTGYNSTSAETRSKYYYASKYTPSGKDWFHLWSFDHDLTTDEFCFHRTINSERLSDVDHDIKKDTNEYRIIGLGDSFTEGDGTATDSTWLKFLERDLSKYTLSKKITFINAGVCGSDPVFEYILLKEKLLKYKPDLVILTTNFSDISDIMIRGGSERFQSDGTLKYNKPPIWEPVYAMSRISRLVFSALDYNEEFMKNNRIDESYSKSKIFQAILKFTELSMLNDFKLIVVFHPSKQEIEQNKMALSDVLDAVRLKTKINYVNMLDYYRTMEHIDSSNCSRYYWVHDGHHNAKGYEVFARGVELKLKEMGILDSLRAK